VNGAKIEKNVLIGIGAIVLDNAVVGENTIIAAGALVKENQICEPNCIYAGVPAIKIKAIDTEQTQHYIERIANNYLMYSDWYK
jgi:carbonic anhydrase/acetyltransferase-like protein (isoleucine patch superfamily)